MNYFCNGIYIYESGLKKEDKHRSPAGDRSNAAPAAPDSSMLEPFGSENAALHL